MHGTEIRKVHFHEVGAIDSIADIVGTAIALDSLGIQRVEASPVPTGHGFITIAHGRCSVPAPATAELLKGIPLAECDVEAELTTPTGAAVLAALGERFGPPPAMTVQKIGYGAGTKEFEEQANLLRVLIGEVAEITGTNAGAVQTEALCLLETNLDNASGEVIGHCATLLMEAGAGCVYYRDSDEKESAGSAAERVVSTRRRSATGNDYFPRDADAGRAANGGEPAKAARKTHEVNTLWGPIKGVVATLPNGEKRFSPEYESCRVVAARTTWRCERFTRRRCGRTAGRKHAGARPPWQTLDPKPTGCNRWAW